MNDVTIFLEDGNQTNVNGIFYIFNSKYYFLYTEKELIDDDYVQMYIVQVGKEVQNTPTGAVDTGYLLGLEIADKTEWANVQVSITKIVDDKKNGTQSEEIQYLSSELLSKLKIVSKNKFKLMKGLLENHFNISFAAQTEEIPQQTLLTVDALNSTIDASNSEPTVETTVNSPEVAPAVETEQPVAEAFAPSKQEEEKSDVIIDYRTKFFEEQDKNAELKQEINRLHSQLDAIRQILNQTE